MTRREPAHRTVPRRGHRPTRVRKHPFVKDATVPPDQHGRDFCTRCRCAGQPGDHKHLTDDDVAQQRREEQRRTGEQP